MELAGEVALETADCLAFGSPFGAVARDVGTGARAVTQPDDKDHVEGGVGGAVAAVIEPMSGRLAGTGSAPQRWAKAASPWRRLMFSSAVTSSCAAC